MQKWLEFHNIKMFSKWLSFIQPWTSMFKLYKIGHFKPKSCIKVPSLDKWMTSILSFTTDIEIKVPKHTKFMHYVISQTDLIYSSHHITLTVTMWFSLAFQPFCNLFSPKERRNAFSDLVMSTFLAGKQTQQYSCLLCFWELALWPFTNTNY